METEIKKNPEKKKSFFRKLLKIALIFTGGFILTLVSIIIFIQTPYFKNKLLQYAVGKVNESLAEKESVLYVESIQGSIIRGFTLKNVSLVVKNDTMLKFSELDANYNINRLLKKEVYLRDVVLTDLQGNFTKIKDNSGEHVWNYEYLLKKEKKEEDTAKKEFDWKITARNFELKNGNVRFLEEKNQDKPLREIPVEEAKKFGFSNLNVTNLNLNLSGYYHPDEKFVNMKEFSFSTNTLIDVKSLIFEASILGDDKADLKNFHIVTTNSDVIINEAYIEHLNPLKEKVIYENFKDKNAYVDILADRFDVSELIFFLPSLDFMKGKAYLDLKAEGKYNDIDIKKLTAKTDGSSISVSGKVQNLHDPKKLYLDVVVKNAELDPTDSKKNLPGIPIPDYSHVGKVSASFTFKGEPTKFNADYDVKTSAGDINGKTFLDIQDKKFSYDADFKTKNVNIGKILKDDKLNSSINADIKANGNGFDYRTLNGNINFDINNSDFYGQKISKSNGTVKANSGDYNIDLSYSSNSLTTKLNGIVGVRDLSKLKYNLKGTVQSFDISTLTKNSEDKSNLNFTFDAQGEGYKPDDINGNYDISFTPSNYQHYIIPQTHMIVKAGINGDERFASVTSDIFDFDAKGKFSYLTIPNIIVTNVRSIADQFKKEFGKDSLESDFSFSNTRTVNVSMVKPIVFTDPSDIYVKYSLTIKNYRPVQLVLKDSSITFSGKISGEISQNKNAFSLNAKGEISNLLYLDSAFSFSKGLIDLDFKNDYTIAKDFGVMFGNVNMKASNLNFNTRKVDTATFSMNYGEDKGLFNLTGNRDTTLRLHSMGKFAIGDNSVRLLFDTLGFGYKNYSLADRIPAKINFKIIDSLNNNEVIEFENLRLVSDNQRLMVTGYYSLNGNSKMELRGQRIRMPELQRLINPEIEDEKIINGELRRFLIKYTGNLDEPELDAELNTEVLSLQKVKLGRIDALLGYHNNTATPQISFFNVNNEGNLQIKGEIPLQNPMQTFREKEQRENLLENDVNLKIAAQNFQVNILEQIIPVISRLKGNLNGNIDVKGKVKRPLLSGNMNIQNGKFRLNMTGMNYNFKADISTQDQKLLFPSVRIFAPYEEDLPFIMKGYIDFTNLEMNDLELSMGGKIKVLDNQISQNVLGVYGELYAKTGQDLVLKGNSERLDMTGHLIMTKGRIYIPPFKKEAYSLYADNFKYKIIFDSAGFKGDSLDIYINKYKDSLKTADKNRLDPFDNQFLTSVNALKKTLSKSSPFHYNVSVSTENKLYVNFIVDEKTGQEFFGNVTANLVFDNRENDSLQVRGRVILEDNCYYKFYKNFEATGNLIFTGNIVNPELNIEAKYNAITTDPSDEKNTRTVSITLRVTGPTFNAKLDWTVLVNGNPRGGSQDQEAISFIVFGKFPDELNADQRLNLVSNVGANVGTSFMSQYISNKLQAYLPFIVNTDINYNSTQSGNVAQNTDIRITAEFGDATVRVGGQIFRDLTNTNVIIEYPLNKLLKMGSLSNNLIFQFERLVDPFNQNKNLTGSARTGGMLYYKIKF